MKKAMYLVLSFLFISVIFVGCSSSEKTKEEIRAEIEAKQAAEEELRTQIKAELEAEQAAEQKAEQEVQEADEEESIDTNTSKDEFFDMITSGSEGLKVIANSLNVRGLASTNGQVVGSVNEGEFYEILDSVADSDENYKTWYKIRLTDGETGWIAGWHCIAYSSDSRIGDKESLEPAFNGFLDGIEIGLGTSSADLFEAWGEPNEIKDSYGGAIAYYDTAWFFILNYGSDNDEVYTMGTSSADLSTDGTMYGIDTGMSESEVYAIIGEPEFVYYWDENSDGTFREIYHATYIVGDYDFIVRYNVESKIVVTFKLQPSRPFEEVKND